jgi:transketolase
MKDDTVTLSAQRIRRIIVDQSRRANVGHIGSALSIADIIATLYGRVLRIDGPDAPDRDRLVLSKGHAALALYAALHLKGWLTEAELNTYSTDGSLLGVHPEHVLRGVDFSTGSLGQGLSIASGTALAARMRGAARRVFVVLSDAECNEGSVWEAVTFAAHHKLSNLVAIIDLNGQQAFGYTRDVLSMSPMAERWRAFGWEAHEVDGHDVGVMARTIGALDTKAGPPHVLVARTTFGKGVSFMHNLIKWHYLPLSAAEHEAARREIDGAA